MSPLRNRLVMINSCAVSTSILVLSLATVATAENWIAGSGNWNTPGNWNPATVPSGGDTVTITPADGVARTVTYNYTGAAVTLAELRVDLTGAGSAATTLSMSANNLTSLSEYIGYNGRGVFNHSGGTNTIAAGTGFLDVGVFPGSTGTYNLSGTGALVANTSEYIGDISAGFFNQTGGSNTIQGAGNNLYLGYNVDNFAGGTYTLSAGSLSVNNGLEFVGYNALGQNPANGGVFNQTGGTNTSLGLYVGYNNPSRGTYNQTGGTNTITSSGGLHLGFNVGSLGIYKISGNASLSVSGEINVGYHSNGGLEITDGGTVTNSANAFIGRDFNSAIGSVVVSGSGSSWNIGGNLTVGQFGDRGKLTIQDQALVHIGDGLVINDTVTLNGGTIRFNDYILNTPGFNFLAGTIQLAGNRDVGTDTTIQNLFGVSPVIAAGKGLTVEGTAELLTPVTLDGGTLSAGQLASASDLQLQRGTLNVTNQAVTIASGGVLGNTLDVNDDMTVNVTLGITNQGLVTGDGQIGGTFTNAAAGELRAEPGRSLKLTGANNTNAGQISLYGGMLEFTQNLTNNAGAFISGNGTLKTTTGLTNNGTMNVSGLANVVGDVTNSATGKVISSGGGPTTFLDDVANQGEIRTSAGSFTVFFGAVTGAGSFTGLGTVNFEGDLKPGNSAAAVNFAGDVVLGPDATLEIEIGGTTAGSGYDQINVAGELSLDGTLEISLINGFTPSAGQSFDILNWGSLAGAFSSFDLPTLPGLAWNTSQLAAGMLSVAIPGDFNLDNSVDAADYVTWRKGIGVASTPENYNLWRAHFGQMAASGAASTFPLLHSPFDNAIPEPSSLLLLAVAAVLAVPTPISLRSALRSKCRP